MKENLPGPAMRADAERLVRLRTDPEAVKAIMLQLLAQKMGPADYIRTKREVQSFVEKGALSEAYELLAHAAERRAAEEQRENLRESNSYRITP